VEWRHQMALDFECARKKSGLELSTQLFFAFFFYSAFGQEGALLVCEKKSC
jgi:hypothetical protein